jgi:hypothetical protein
MLTFDQERQAIREAISRFPKYFNLPNCPHTARISETSSFFSGDTLYLYTEVQIDGQWLSYAKATESDLRAVIRTEVRQW